MSTTSYNRIVSTKMAMGEEYEKEVESLAKKNDELRTELWQLNEEITKRLRSKGELLPPLGSRVVQATNALYQTPEMKEHEKARRENARLLKKLRENTSLLEVQEIKDALAEKQKQIDEIELQNSTLEQVSRHQSKGLEHVTRLETELDEIARVHSRDVMKYKKDIKSERAARDEIQKQVTMNQVKIASLKTRINSAKSPLAEKWGSIDQLRQQLDKKDAILEDLSRQVEEARRNNNTDEELKQLRKEYRENTSEVQKLQSIIQETKQKVVETEKVLQMSASPYLWKFSKNSPTAGGGVGSPYN